MELYMHDIMAEKKSGRRKPFSHFFFLKVRIPTYIYFLFSSPVLFCIIMFLFIKFGYSMLVRITWQAICNVNVLTCLKSYLEISSVT